jgi:hypothetical protein
MSPYRDEWGEEDAELRRARPLWLSAPAYAQFSALLATGALDFDSAVLRGAVLHQL